MANLAPRITLRQLVQYLYETSEPIQICEPGGEWTDYSTFHNASRFLEPFLDCEIKELSAQRDEQGEPIMRVDLNIPEEGDA